MEEKKHALTAPRLPAEARRPAKSLRRAIRRYTTRRRVRVALAVAQEVAALHADGTTVGTLTPDSVTFGMTGYPDIVRSAANTAPPPYVAPELTGNESHPLGTASGDVYALGALLYFILTSREPPATWSTGVLSQLTPTASSLVAQCVATDPTLRPSADEVAQIIERAGVDRLHGAGLSQPIELIRRKPRQAWNIASVVALTSTATLLVLAGTASTVLGAVGVAAMLVGASISVGANF